MNSTGRPCIPKDVTIREEDIVEFPYGGYLIRGLFSDREQESIYDYMCSFAAEQEKKDLDQLDLKGNPWPLMFYNHVYTRTSTCGEPTQFKKLIETIFSQVLAFAKGKGKARERTAKDGLSLYSEEGKATPGKGNPEKKEIGGEKKCAALEEKTEKEAIPEQDTQIFKQNLDSIYAQLYPEGGFMDTHVDIGLSWGLSLSLGASSEFVYGQHNTMPPMEITEDTPPAPEKHNSLVVLRSGDVFIGNFGKVYHGARRMLPEEMPKWWSNERYVRLNVQARDVRSWRAPPTMKTKEEYRNFLLTLIK